MSIGEVIAALANYAGTWEGDELLLTREVFSIEVVEDSKIKLDFVDHNTNNVMIDKKGRLVTTFGE